MSSGKVRAAVKMSGSCIAILLAAGLLAGCAENSDMMKAVSWFKRPDNAPPQKTVLALPEMPDALGLEGFEGGLRNAMELARAKRFPEARAMIADLAGQIPPESDLWRSLKCSEMTLALRGNDLVALIEAGEAVERNLKDPLRPPPDCVAQVAVARALRGRPLPLNAPDTLTNALQSVPRPREARTVAASAVDRSATAPQVTK